MKILTIIVSYNFEKWIERMFRQLESIITSYRYYRDRQLFE